MSIALVSRTVNTTLLRSGNTLYRLQSGQVCVVSPPSKHLPNGLWQLYKNHDAWLSSANPIAETRTEPDNAFFRSALV
jgi:hypothetical protein